MITQICQEIRNWFDRDQPRITGMHKIKDGCLHVEGLQDGQYFRIIGSTFNDGVYLYPAMDLRDETFYGTVSFMAVPQSFVSLVEEIEDWQMRYGGSDSTLMSPYSAESFGGYSYSKAGGGASDGTTKAGTWQGAFATRLNVWRKI